MICAKRELHNMVVLCLHNMVVLCIIFRNSL
jgi:hypothetical protein